MRSLLHAWIPRNGKIMQKRTSNFSSLGFGHPFDHIYVYNWLQHVFTCHVFHLLFQKCGLSSKFFWGGGMLYFQITRPWNQRPLAAYPQRNSNSQPGHGSAPHQRSASVRVVKLLYHLTVTDGFQRGWSWWSWKKGKTSPGLFSYYNTYGVYDKIHISVKNEKKLYGNLVSGKGFSISKFQCIKAEDSDNTNIRQLGSLCVGHGRSKIWCWKIWLKDSRLQHFVPEESFEAAASAQDNSTPWRHESCMFVWFVWGGSIS